MHCRLTEPLGMRIAEFPLNPMFAKMLLESGKRKKDQFLHSHLIVMYCYSFAKLKLYFILVWSAVKRTS